MIENLLSLDLLPVDLLSVDLLSVDLLSLGLLSLDLLSLDLLSLDLVSFDLLWVLSVDRACHKDDTPTAFHPLAYTNEGASQLADPAH